MMDKDGYSMSKSQKGTYVHHRDSSRLAVVERHGKRWMVLTYKAPGSSGPSAVHDKHSDAIDDAKSYVNTGNFL